MQIVSSSDARNNLAAIIEQAQHEPVAIQKQGRNAAVMLSYQEYERLTNAMKSAFNQICDDIGHKAAERGVNEDKLAEILAEDE